LQYALGGGESENRLTDEQQRVPRTFIPFPSRLMVWRGGLKTFRYAAISRS
jgi:hypothetical protein